ncbi:unnamed protein product [Caenorhabditis auriculariae]|uniref:Winged helix Storkhead-box1 domain-containing protein n=1 Tax=Caenorhabditis auriculariae TaxID=2777116 RepID=A0A8S1H9R5_9PELO|nr:unnamed protein product [Caenorhabditis auriculariae]
MMTCLAVVMDGPRAKNGRRLFESFVEQNKLSFWNRELVAAADALIYMGFMRPSTMFVSASHAHLKTLKDAWARRILKPAEGYAIASLGDLGAIQQVEQMHFVPLGDVLCDAIAQLNRSGQPATEMSVRQYVARYCPHVAPPGIDMVKQTVMSLVATGLVYRMGEHLFVSVPTNTPPKHKTTVECQTGTSMMAPQPGKRRGFLARIFARGVRPSPMPPVPHPVSFSPEECLATLQPHRPPAMPIKNKFPTYHENLARESRPPLEQRRRRRREPKLLSSSSECLNYGPIDPPEYLPAGRLEVVDDITKRRKRVARTTQVRRRDTIARTSTPIETDSAYSPSPVHSNEEAASLSDPEIFKINHDDDHTYMNLVQNHYESTQFEDLTAALAEDLERISMHAAGVHVSNL